MHVVIVWVGCSRAFCIILSGLQSDFLIKSVYSTDNNTDKDSVTEHETLLIKSAKTFDDQ